MCHQPNGFYVQIVFYSWKVLLYITPMYAYLKQTWLQTTTQLSAHTVKFHLMAHVLFIAVTKTNTMGMYNKALYLDVSLTIKTMQNILWQINSHHNIGIGIQPCCKKELISAVISNGISVKWKIHDTIFKLIFTYCKMKFFFSCHFLKQTVICSSHYQYQIQFRLYIYFSDT